VAEFQLTAAEQEYAAQVRETARLHLAPLAGRSGGRVNRPLLTAMGQLGLLRGLFGGQPDEPPRDAAALQLCLLRESLAQVSGEAETALALQGLGSYPILQSGPPALAARWLPEVISGQAVAAFALSEPGAGSDAAALTLTADRDGAGWRLAGEKTWISNAPDADIYTVFARTTPGAGARGVTAFAVAGDSPGLTGEPLEMISPHPIGRLAFDGLRVTADDVLGQPDAGFAVAMRTLDLFRPSVGAFAVGMAQAALDATVGHVRDRQVFGAPLARQQAVAHKIADMATDLAAARLLVYAAAAAYDGAAEPGLQSRRSAMAKLFATEAAQRIVDGCVQLHGARALQRGHLLEHLYRDVRALRIYEGASEIQRSIIARDLIGREATS
jgi:alkylation response protein AidB-like acyl-CoA dehydrogenase